MSLPNRDEAKVLLESHVQDTYQRYHALMVATAMAGYAKHFGLSDDDQHLWWLAGYLHDLDFDQFPDAHPAEELKWFAEWGYPADFIHAVEAHAYGYHGYTTLPQSKLAAALVACDEISGIFYAYRKMNPIPYGQMKAKSIRKKIAEPSFAAKIDRTHIQLGCDHLGVPMDEHVVNLITFFGDLE